MPRKEYRGCTMPDGIGKGGGGGGSDGLGGGTLAVLDVFATGDRVSMRHSILAACEVVSINKPL